MATQLGVAVLACAWAASVAAQTPPSTWPQVYPNMPSGDYSPEWQDYFAVTESLPNVTWPLANNFAGNIPVQRQGHPNDTLFFWAFEHSNGSLTADAGASDEPWGIWLNGGPGSSSLVGLLFENGPIQIANDYSAFQNNYAWTTIADYVYIDQPVGVGFGTADSDGYVYDEDQMASDFFGFLENLVKVFPSLATRPLHLTGESYAGVYIPYITKAYFGLENPPVKLAKIAIGDGSIAAGEVFEIAPVVSVLETYPQIIGYDTAVLDYFREQTHLCGFDLNLTYPQDGHFPTLQFQQGADPNSGDFMSSYRNRMLDKAEFSEELERRFANRELPSARERIRKRDAWKRDLSGRANGTIDSWYGCDLYDEMLDYAVNFSYPWTLSQANGGTFDYYNIPDALSPEAPQDATVFLNNNQTRAAIHAPTSKDWEESIYYPFGNEYGSSDNSDPPMVFLTDLATNATKEGVSIIIFSGNDDSLIPHYGSQVTIQNTTFGGVQGFSVEPQTPWYNDDGEFAGIVHQERNWTYVLVEHAGHLVGNTNPTSALVFAREFVFGNNQTGLVTNSSGTVSVVGGQDTTLGEIMTGQADIYYGSATTESSYAYGSATVAAWNAYVATATAAPPLPTPDTDASSSAGRRAVVGGGVFGALAGVVEMLVV
ncbi:alpha beta-hydrolase [Coniophora puteana RWD-64-598 SS2]|uniref:Carboxypeptidase n=1 Tax=Coniophora puteana (strain RWD-64-598) TaxID=741705 RepID=A0A5M3MJI8_CONPW|nr:alpha beta-hydrolase [Coniophora puteana RWD-64-598 SS2]EIW79100.1 alpha beta-hydrolase [Coniophora puteana RWD-64-598 SS2]